MISSINIFAKFLPIVSLLFLTTACKKYISVGPPINQLTGAAIFENEGTAVSSITGIYNRMMSSYGIASGSFSGISFLAGLSADEYINHYFYGSQFYQNELVPSNQMLSHPLWNEAYQYVYSANAVIEGLNRSTSLSAEVKKQLEGEARFIRAFFFFYLVNLWGDIPIVSSTDYLKNNVLNRNRIDSVYDFIEQDLQICIPLLNEQYVQGTTEVTIERVRPNAAAARSFLARVYLYRQNWKSAEDLASLVMSKTDLYQLSAIDDVFLKNSSETIWQLFPVIPGINTWDGSLFIVPEGSIPYSATISESLKNAFEIGDQRKNSWLDSVTTQGITYVFPYKYKISYDTEVKEYSMILRLAEQYLIRAEARTQQNNLSGAMDDVNTIRSRAGLAALPTTLTKEELLEAILQERRVELFSEWGHRWLDLKRTAKINAVLAVEKPATWEEHDHLYPIPQAEVLINSRITQNFGY